MRDGGADSISDEGTLDQDATLMTARAQAALFAGEGEEEFVITVRALKAHKAGLQISATQK